MNTLTLVSWSLISEGEPCALGAWLSEGGSAGLPTAQCCPPLEIVRAAFKSTGPVLQCLVCFSKKIKKTFYK